MLFKYDNGVAPDQRRLIEDSIHLAKKYLGDVWTLNVYAAENSKLFCDEYALQGFNEDCKALDGFLAVSTGYHIFIKTYAEGWQRSPAPIRIHEIVHEYFHVVQHFLINRRSPVYAPRSSGAFWLTEGSAEFAGAQVLYYEGLFDVALIRRSKILEARQIRAPLKSLETRGGAKAAGSGSEYSLGFLGTEYLALNYGGRQSLLDYYETIGTSLPWQDAFKKTFGMSVDEFYDNFAEYRRVNFPPNP